MTTESTSRRNFIQNTLITSAGALIASALPFPDAMAAQKSKSKPQSDSQTHSSQLIQNSSTLSTLAVLRKAATECILKGDSCIQHCQEQLAEGEKEFIECLQTVQPMVALAQAVEKLASLKSIRLQDVLEAAIFSAKACKQACDSHSEHFKEGMHKECQECSECCARFITALENTQRSIQKT